ncbi:hypothetical protein ACFC0S_14880 [Streptomyces sp. NPDC056084]
MFVYCLNNPINVEADDGDGFVPLTAQRYVILLAHPKTDGSLA